MDILKRLAATVLPRLAERSTVLGILTLLSVVGGLVLAPERVEAITTIVTTIAGLALVLVKEVKPIPVEAAVVAQLVTGVKL